MRKRWAIIFSAALWAYFLAGVASAGECENWRTIKPDWLHCDDFETNQNLSTYYYDISTNGFSASADDPMLGNYSLKQHYVAGQVDAGWIAWSYCDTLGYDWAARTGDPKKGCHDEIYMRWYHKFEEGFSPNTFPPKMARITSIGPGWDKRFGVYYWIDGDVCDSCIVADVNSANGWLPIIRTGFSYENPVNIGRWTEHEMYIKKNSSGQADGAYSYWIDGKLSASRSNVNLANDYNFNNAMLDCYWNGGSPKEQNRYFDNFVISVSYVGPLQCENGKEINYPCYCNGLPNPSDSSNVYISGYCCDNLWQTGSCSSGGEDVAPDSPNGLNVS